MSSLTTLKITVGWCEESAIFGIYILNCFLEKGSKSTFLAFFPNDKEISKEPEGGLTRNYKKMLTLSFENIHVLLSSNSSLPIYYNIFSILVHCAKDAEIIQPVVEEDEENDEELEFEIWRKPQLPKMATVAIVSEMEKNRPNNMMGITPDSSSESSWSMKLWKSNLKWKRKRNHVAIFLRQIILLSCFFNCTFFGQRKNNVVPQKSVL